MSYFFEFRIREHTNEVGFGRLRVEFGAVHPVGPSHVEEEEYNTGKQTTDGGQPLRRPLALGEGATGVVAAPIIQNLFWGTKGFWVPGRQKIFAPPLPLFPFFVILCFPRLEVPAFLDIF